MVELPLLLGLREHGFTVPGAQAVRRADPGPVLQPVCFSVSRPLSVESIFVGGSSPQRRWHRVPSASSDASCPAAQPTSKPPARNSPWPWRHCPSERGTSRERRG